MPQLWTQRSHGACSSAPWTPDTLGKPVDGVPSGLLTAQSPLGEVFVFPSQPGVPGDRNPV